MIKHFLVGLLFCFSFLTGYAQFITPLDSYPNPQPSENRFPARLSAVGDTLELPFFDDFTRQPIGPANRLNWQPGGGALVNNQFGINPPSIGVATLEGIRADGLPYNSLTSYGYSDTLTSKPLNLQPYNRATDSVYLSFYWQAGGLAGSPDESSDARPVFLALEFKDQTGRWNEVWRQTGQGNVTDFKRENIRISVTQSANYLYNGFQFRFRNAGVQKGTGDAWNLDYIYLANKINPDKTLLEDVAISHHLNSLLNRFTAMPAWQFLANPGDELNDSAYTTLNNLNNRFAPITWRGFTRVISTTQPADTFLRSNAAIEPMAQQFLISGKPVLTTNNATGNLFSVESALFINSRETFAPTRQNDTISRITEFSDYFAYDDGTAETNFSLDKTGQRQGAYAFDLNVPDMVKGVRVYLSKTNVPGHQINFMVWDADEKGNPAVNPKAQQGFRIPAVDTLNRFYDILFPAAVPVEGTFFIGWGLGNNVADFVNIGFDLNEGAPGKIFYNNNRLGWEKFSDQRGALMMRPIMGRVTGNKDIIQDQSFINVFPNPSSGVITMQGSLISWQLTDATGKTLAAGAGKKDNQLQLDLSYLANGLYFIHCQTKQGIITKKISITH